MNKLVASDLLVEHFRDEITKFSNFLYETTINCLLLLVVCSGAGGGSEQTSGGRK